MDREPSRQDSTTGCHRRAAPASPADGSHRLTDVLPVIVHRTTLSPMPRVDYVSRAVQAVLGYMPEEVVADPDPVRMLVHPDDRSVVVGLVRSPEELAAPFVVRCMHRDGHIVWCETRCGLVRDGGRVVAVEGVTFDVATPNAGGDTAASEVLRDPVTGLANPILFREHLTHAYSRRTRGVASPAVMVIDLDSAGEGLVAEVAVRVVSTVGESVTMGRTDGGGVAILFEDVPEPDLPVRVAEQLLQRLAQPVGVDGTSTTVTVSIGIAHARPDLGDSPADLLEHASAAARSARAQGGGHQEVFDRGLRERIDRRLRSEADLRRALDRNEFTLHYQPEVRLDTGETVAVEALLRWLHPEHGLLEPHDFLQAAEESGLMVPIGAWVLEEACRRQVEWTRRRGNAATPAVVVNLSPGQISDPEVIAEVAGVMARTGIEPGALCLDVTEAALAHDPVMALDVLQAFRRMGIRVAVDDFGTGYASLSIVRSFPVDAVKIDRSVVGGLETDPAAVGLCAAVVELAAGCGLEVCAEGVETPAQRSRLTALGATRAQGDLFRPASPPEELGLTLSLVPD